MTKVSAAVGRNSRDFSDVAELEGAARREQSDVIEAAQVARQAQLQRALQARSSSSTLFAASSVRTAPIFSKSARRQTIVDEAEDGGRGDGNRKREGDGDPEGARAEDVSRPHRA